MFKRLEEVEKRYRELVEKAADPKVFGDPGVYRKVAKERAELEEVVGAYREYKRVEGEITSHRGLLSGDDDELRRLAKEELPLLEENLSKLEGDLKILLLPKDPSDEKNIFVEIRAGTGGEEAALFAADLFRMYSRYAETRGWRVEIMDSSYTGIGGIKEIIAMISGDRVYSDLKYESGVHRVQRVPKTEASGRIHTSAVTVAVLPEADDLEVDIQEKDLKIDVFRASGPGGQGVNTTDSAVRITHIPTGMVVTCRDERSQIKNKAKAMKVLKARLLEKMQEEQTSEIGKTRKAMVGSGDRSEKIRTYNFPQNRVTDHRIGLTIHKLDYVLDGHLEEVIPTLRAYYQAEALKSTA